MDKTIIIEHNKINWNFTIKTIGKTLTLVNIDHLLDLQQAVDTMISQYTGVIWHNEKKV